ncbi:MAG: hypothetical protein DRO67_01360 [Candidatus Asgardarchaeum californiense]|nr:MAG: hypothetical protein DRO67_01360 [Candidatus Asgardarchaeum californiense]
MSDTIVHFRELNKILENVFKKEKVLVSDYLFHYQYGVIDLESNTFYLDIHEHIDLDSFKVSRHEYPSIYDVRDALLISQSIEFGGLKKLIDFISIYMDITEGAPLALGLDTNIVLNGLLNPFREIVEKTTWKGSLLVVVPSIVYQEINRLYLEEYSRTEARRLGNKDIEGLQKKIARLSIAGLMNLTKLREVVQVKKFGAPVSPTDFTSSEAGKYFNDFMVREQIRQYAQNTGTPTLHISADKDSVMMARAEGTPSVLIEIPKLTKKEYLINLDDFIYSLAILRGMVLIKSENNKNFVLIKTIWPDKSREDWFSNLIKLKLNI